MAGIRPCSDSGQGGKFDRNESGNFDRNRWQLSSEYATSLEESSSDIEVLLNKRLELILWGICIVIGIPEFDLGDKVYGCLQQNTSVQSSIKIAPGIPHLYQTVQEISQPGAGPIPPEITIDELNQAVQFATCMETIDNLIENERRTSGIPDNRSITHLYTRPMGGFMAFRLGVPLFSHRNDCTNLHVRLRHAYQQPFEEEMILQVIL